MIRFTRLYKPLLISAVVAIGSVAALMLFLTAPLILFALAFLIYLIEHIRRSRTRSNEQ